MWSIAVLHTETLHIFIVDSWLSVISHSEFIFYRLYSFSIHVGTGTGWTTATAAAAGFWDVARLRPYPLGRTWLF
jgi:hypothetical protein